ncbi:MAG TPA: hypothetical protein ENK75_06770, partial [Saprospiraceae bacterium]|nr:hypothetical protein [Saprospiraceae bacterium]
MIKNDFLLKAMAVQLIDQPYFLLTGQILTGRPQQVNHYITHQISQEQNPNHKRYLLYLQWLSETYANNLYPDVAGNDGLEMMDRWNSQDILQQTIENINSLRIEEVDTAGNLFGSLMPMLQSHRAFLKGIVFSNDGFGDQLLDLSLKNLQELENLFREQKAPPAYFYFLDLV